jgi:hypothetical protein
MMRGMEEAHRKDLKDRQALPNRSFEDLIHPAAISLKDLSEMASTPQNPHISFRRLEKDVPGMEGEPP